VSTGAWHEQRRRCVGQCLAQSDMSRQHEGIAGRVCQYLPAGSDKFRWFWV
jgi:hypothetical protein